MVEEKNNKKADNDFEKLLEKDSIDIPQVIDIVKGTVISASKSEVKLDINGVLIGIVRGPELYFEAEEYANLKPGDEVEATVIEEENENGELELSFKYAGQEKSWTNLRNALKNKEIIKVKVVEANKGGLLVRFNQIFGFLPVSQLAPENYPRVSGGDKSKILEKLKSFIGNEFDVKIITLDEKEDKIIFSEKNVWNEKQKDVIGKYKAGIVVDGVIAAVTDFGVFISFGDNMEGLIHISELAWQRIDNPSDLYKVKDKIKAKVIGVEGSKIFLSAKQLVQDPWDEVNDKYKEGQIVKGTILKVNPFGLFVKIDDNIHGLAHISQIGLAKGQKINEVFKFGMEVNFEIMSIEPKAHRLGLKFVKDKDSLADSIVDSEKSRKKMNEKKNKNDINEKKNKKNKDDKNKKNEKDKKKTKNKKEEIKEETADEFNKKEFKKIKEKDKEK